LAGGDLLLAQEKSLLVPSARARCMDSILLILGTPKNAAIKANLSKIAIGTAISFTDVFSPEYIFSRLGPIIGQNMYGRAKPLARA